MIGPELRPSLDDLPCGTPGVGNIDFEIPDRDKCAEPAALD